MVRHRQTRIPLIVRALFVVHSAFAASGITVEGRVVLDPPADGDVSPRIWVEGWGSRESIECETDGSYRVELPEVEAPPSGQRLLGGRPPISASVCTTIHSCALPTSACASLSPSPAAFSPPNLSMR
jgi:hypothetical protein